MRYLVVGGVAVVLHGYLKTEATVIALEDLIALKRGVGRIRDLDDIAALEMPAEMVEESEEHSDE